MFDNVRRTTFYATQYEYEVQCAMLGNLWLGYPPVETAPGLGVIRTMRTLGIERYCGGVNENAK